MANALAEQLSGVSVQLAVAGERAALAALGVAWDRAQARLGEHVGGLWPFWSRISGGQALATNTSAPWAGRLEHV